MSLINREDLIAEYDRVHVGPPGGARKLMVDAPEVLPEPKWIPVSERLPEDGKKKYWVCTDTEYQCECRWTNINHIMTDLTIDWHWHIMDIPQYSKVIAWMPLPEPYREEGGER